VAVALLLPPPPSAGSSEMGASASGRARGEGLSTARTCIWATVVVMRAHLRSALKARTRAILRRSAATASAFFAAAARRLLPSARSFERSTRRRQ
jgi:hypothetical protein